MKLVMPRRPRSVSQFQPGARKEANFSDGQDDVAMASTKSKAFLLYLEPYPAEMDTIPPP